jgi:hypothetical protein
MSKKIVQLVEAPTCKAEADQTINPQLRVYRRYLPSEPAQDGLVIRLEVRAKAAWRRLSVTSETNGETN